MQNLNRTVTSKEMILLIKSFPSRKTQDFIASLLNSTILKTPILSKLVPAPPKRRGALWVLFLQAALALVPALDTEMAGQRLQWCWMQESPQNTGKANAATCCKAHGPQSSGSIPGRKTSSVWPSSACEHSTSTQERQGCCEHLEGRAPDETKHPVMITESDSRAECIQD